MRQPAIWQARHKVLADLTLVSKGGAVTESSASLTLTNGIGNTHGLEVYEDRTVLSGGVNSTQLILSDDNATFSNQQTGAPIQVKGVAEGTAGYDAVNCRQLKEVRGGVASTAAMANIPALDERRKVSFGIGLGVFKSSTTVAIGGNFRMSPSSIFRVSVGHAGSTYTGGMGAALAW